MTIDPGITRPVPKACPRGVAATVAVPGAMPTTPPEPDTVRTAWSDDDQATAENCEGGVVGEDVLSPYETFTVN